MAIAFPIGLVQLTNEPQRFQLFNQTVFVRRFKIERQAAAHRIVNRLSNRIYKLKLLSKDFFLFSDSRLIEVIVDKSDLYLTAETSVGISISSIFLMS